MRIQNLVLLLVVAVVMTACGGGGSSDGSSGGSNSTYNGLTTQATLTDDNAQEMALDAYFTGYSGNFLGASLTEDQPPLQAQISSVGLSQIIHDTIYATTPTETVRALINEPVDGPDGGVVQVTGDYNETTETFSGTYTYTNWQSGNLTINGQMTVYINGFYSTESTIEVNCRNLTITVEGVSSAVLNGTLAYEINGSAQTVSLDLVTTEGSGVQCMVDGYELAVTSSGDTTINGVFYHSDYGYVTVVTTQVITSDSNGFPNGGVIEITGADNTRATVTFAPGSATIVADCDGDGDLDDFTATELFY